jgi:hypothetical protein
MELLESVWSGLNDAFTLAIKSYGETVVGIVRRSRKGVNVASIREKAGFDDKQIRTYIYKAKRQGKIKNLKRGIYVSS